MNRTQQYHQRAALDISLDIIKAAQAYDAEAMQRAWKTVQNIANAMEKHVVAFFPLDDSVDPGLLSNGHSEGGGGGHKVESAKPDPVLPSGGAAARLSALL